MSFISCTERYVLPLRDFFCPSANPQDLAVSERILCRGAPASAGAAVGVLAFSVAEAQLCAASNQPCILLTRETSVDDIAGLKVISPAEPRFGRYEVWI
jgi:hypothetical protein